MKKNIKICCCNMIQCIKIELRCINRKKTTLMAAIFVFLGIMDAIVCGNFYIYEILILPKAAPGKWVFIIAWTSIYAIIGCGFSLILAKKERYCALPRSKGIMLFVCMMIFNLLWCPLFFGAEAFFSAFLNILIMIILVFFTAVYFMKVSILAAVSQIILEIWLFYCALLNLGIILIN